MGTCFSKPAPHLRPRCPLRRPGPEVPQGWRPGKSGGWRLAARRIKAPRFCSHSLAPSPGPLDHVSLLSAVPAVTTSSSSSCQLPVPSPMPPISHSLACGCRPCLLAIILHLITEGPGFPFPPCSPVTLNTASHCLPFQAIRAPNPLSSSASVPTQPSHPLRQHPTPF